MYDLTLHKSINKICKATKLDSAGSDNGFYGRILAEAGEIRQLYDILYDTHLQSAAEFEHLLKNIVSAYTARKTQHRERDAAKAENGHWYLSNQLAGMSLYVDRFCGDLPALKNKLDYFTELGINVLHLMPLFESPAGESDGGYAVSDFRKVDARFGNLNDLIALQRSLQDEDKYLMLDIVLNHTSQQHEWAVRARNGEKTFQDFFYMYDDRQVPDRFDAAMPEIFPESAPGNFTWVPECGKWVMTVFHSYQWDLNYTNPAVFNAMLENIFFYANLGVDILRIDAPAFIWKLPGTTCQNLPQAHTLLRLIRLCVEVATPGMALLGEAIVAPKQIMEYFGKGQFTGRECHFAYNATQMALQWDALATGDTRIMLAAQHDLLRKPFGSSWITYTRCHDDIGLGFEDASIAAAGFNAYQHRKFLQDYYSGKYPGSTATGALFSVNAKTADARISGSLASLCGLEAALNERSDEAISTAVNKIVLMQAQSILLGGLPMLFYGDEVGYTNDYNYIHDAGKTYDNRWMHRPLIDWKKNELRKQEGTVEAHIFSSTQRLIAIRKQLTAVADLGNISWMIPHNIHVAGFVRKVAAEKIFCLFNYSNKPAYLTWYALRENGDAPKLLFDHWHQKKIKPGGDHEYLVLEPYGVYILEAKMA